MFYTYTLFRIEQLLNCLLFIVFMPLSVAAQFTESFETGLPTTYNATLTSYSLSTGLWQAKDVQAGSLGWQSGSKSAQFRSATGSQLITPTFANGVATFSFYISASTASGAYQVNVSTNGGQTWSPAPGSPFTIGTTKTFRQINLNSYAINKIQIYRTGAVLYADDIQLVNMPIMSIAQLPTPHTKIYGNTSVLDSLTVNILSAVSSLSILPPNGFHVSLQSNFSGSIGTAQQALVCGSFNGGSMLKLYVRLSDTCSVGTYAGPCVITSSAQVLSAPIDTFQVYPKPITIQGLQVQNKEYDGLLTANIIGQAYIANILPWDSNKVYVVGTPQANYNSADVNTAQSVIVSGLSMSGIAANNYTCQPTTILPGSILPAHQVVVGNCNNRSMYLGSKPLNLNLQSNWGLPLNYISSNNNIAAVSASGVVTAFDTGKVLILVQQAGSTNVLPLIDTAIGVDIIRPNCMKQTGTLKYSYTSNGLASTSVDSTQLLFVDASVLMAGEGISANIPLQLTNVNPSTNYVNASAGYYAQLVTRSGNFSTDSTRCFTWSVQIDMAQQAKLTAFQFGSRTALNGPQAYCLRTSLDNYQTNWLSGTLSNTNTWNLINHNTFIGQIPPNAGEVIFKLFAYDGVASPDSSSLIWNVDDIQMQWELNNLPDSALTGPNQLRCGSLISLPLGGNEPGIGTGYWSLVSGPGTAVFLNEHQGNTTVQVSMPGLYTFRWHIVGNACIGENTADVQVQFTSPFLWDSVIVTPPNCFNDSAHVYFVTIGGIGQSSFTLNTQTPIANQCNILPGVYTVQATDGIGCTLQTSLTILTVAPLQVSTQILHASCYGTYGLLTILAQGGNGGYTYQVNGNGVTPTSNLLAGTYTVLVSDVLGCTFQTIITINQPLPIAIQTNVQAPTCINCLNTLTVNPNGGVSPYIIQVNGVIGGPTFSLSSGVYTVTIHDANACTASTIINITQQIANVNYPPNKITKYVYGHAAVITWENNSDSVYRFEYKEVGAPSWIAVYVISPSDTLFPLQNNTTYQFRIKAIDSGGLQSTWYTDTFQTTQGCNQPVFNSPIVHAQSFGLSWTSHGVSSFRLEYKAVDSLIWRSVNTALTQRVVYGLSQGTTYLVRLKSFCPVSDWSDWTYDTITTTMCEPPVYTSILPLGNSIRVSWNATPNVAMYRLEYKNTQQANWIVFQQVDTSKFISGLTPNTTYQCRVRKLMASSDTSLWAYQSITTSAGCSTPYFQSPYVQGNLACLYWNATADSAYRFEYRRLNDVNWQAFLQPTTTKCIQNLTPNTAYVCRVKAYLKNKDYSNWAYDTIYTTAGCSLPIFNLPIITGTQVYLSWSHPSATQFRLEYQLPDAGTWTSLRLRLPYRTLFNLNQGTSYRIRVRAECANGDISSWVYDSLSIPMLRSTNNAVNNNIETSNLLEPTIYPNPFNNNLNICWNDNCNNIEIFDALGHLMYSYKPSQCNVPGYCCIQTQNWPAGIYVVRIHQTNKPITHTKFMKL